MTVVAEYVWIGGGGELRSKIKVMPGIDEVLTVEGFPEWNYDGSSTRQAEGKYSEVLMRPRAFFPNPFGPKNCKNSYLVMCDTYYPNGTPLENNHRQWADQIFKQALDEEPWYGLEQEYFLVDPETDYPLGFDPKTGEKPHLGFQGPYYCSVGAGRAFGRHIADEHLDACLYAGLKISGTNAEVAPGQWEYQIGPCTGIEIGDHMYISRYLLWRIAEKYNVALTLDPKPIKGDWNGSGCHVNFSTKNMRDGTPTKSGLDYIKGAIAQLATHHAEHMKLYGEGNERRMTGHHETATFDKFTYGVANRGASVRIPNMAERDGKGYFEDRRPASNMDPYLVCGKIFETCVLKLKEPVVQHVVAHDSDSVDLI